MPVDPSPFDRSDLAARWFIRARARGDAFTEEHARRVEELGARFESSGESPVAVTAPVTRETP